jgi:undecaprenyl-diphosphatase
MAPDQAFDSSDEVLRYERSPIDVLRFLSALVAALFLVVTTKVVDDLDAEFEEPLTRLLEVPWERVRVLIDSALLAGMVMATVAVLVVPLVTRRWRLFGYVVAANVLVDLASRGIGAWLGSDLAGSTVDANSAVQLAESYSTRIVNAAQLIAAFVVFGPFVSRRWRRAGVWTVGIVLLLRLVVAVGTSTNLLLVLAVGYAAGAGILLAFGRPVVRARPASILAALRGSGVPAVGIDRAAVDARGSTPYFATLADGSKVFAKVLGSTERAADLLFRIIRAVRLKNVGDERPFSSLRRTVEHEALVALAARDVGVNTPRLRCVAPVGGSSYLLAYDLIDGGSLDSVPADELTHEVISGIWAEVANLRQHRIAHRDLRLANVFLGADGAPWLIDFGFSEVAASDALLDADVAELVTSLAEVVGPERAVSPAVEVIGADAVAAALPRIQPAAMSGATRAALKQHKGLLDELREEIQRQCGVEEPELEPLTRFGGRQVFTLVMLVAVIYFLVPQLADLPGIVERVQEANWAWMAPLLVASAGTYLAATMSISGCVPGHLPPGPTFFAQVASSFASKVAPAGLGGMALNVRYLQRQGIDAAVATSGIGFNAVAGVAGHLTLIAVFIGLAGREAFGDFKLPSPRSFLIGMGVALAVGAIAAAVPATRKLIRTKLLPILGRSIAGLRDVVTSPVKMAMAIIGSALVTLSYVVAFFFAGHAFGIDLRFAAMGAIYLVGSAVATAAPTPGGLGAVEAALIGGLIAAGVDKDFAVPAVFLYRLGTFWIPILPGWLAFTWLRRTDHL